jgi:hypothetical protein
VGERAFWNPTANMGAIWLLVPVALIAGSIMLLLLSLAVRGRLRRSRAARA